MVFIESGLVAPLFAEVACGGPAECHRRGSKDHGADQRKGALLKSDGVDISPCEGEADHDQSDAPAGGWRAGDLLLSGGLLAGLDEGERPGDPAGKQLDKGGNVKHGIDFNRGEGEATRENDIPSAPVQRHCAMSRGEAYNSELKWLRRKKKYSRWLVPIAGRC